MYSNVDLSLPSSIGNILLKTLSIPFESSLNCSLREISSLKLTVKFSWTSIRLGIDKPSKVFQSSYVYFFW